MSAMREIVFDTETTGFDPEDGHRICEIGALELIDRVPTGRTFHELINPCRDMPEEAYAVHGHSSESLANKPVFAAIAKPFLDFVGEAPLIAHNAMFDLRFINWELRYAGLNPFASDRIVDTLALAKKKFPGAKLSLDALCGRFGIDLGRRMKHGALLDSELLSQVYVELTGGRQRGMDLSLAPAAAPADRSAPKRSWPARNFTPSEAELIRHRAFIAKLTAPLWDRYAEALGE